MSVTNIPSKSHRESTKARPRLPGETNSVQRAHFEHVERIPPKMEKQSRRQRIRHHWARFWCCYVLAAVVFLAVFLPLLFLEIIPALAQLIVNRTNLPIYSGTIQAVSSEELIVSLSTSLTVPAGLKVKLAPLVLYLYNKESPEYSPFLTVPIDGRLVTGRTEINVVNETVLVANLTELVTWLNTALLQNTTKFSVKGNTTAHLGALKAHLNLDKTVEIPALRQLEGVEISSATLVNPPAEDGSNIVGHITLPNWSELTLGLGNNTLNVWAGDILVGNAVILDVHLPPGNTTIPFRGRVYIDKLIDNFASILSEQAEALTSGHVNLWVNGNETIINGEHVAYLEYVLGNAHIGASIPIIQLASDLFGSFLDGNFSLSGLGDLLGGGSDDSDDLDSSGDDENENTRTNPFLEFLDELNITRAGIRGLTEAVAYIQRGEFRARESGIAR